MRNATRIVLALAILAVMTTVSPARADILVRFGVSAGHYAPGACLLSVPQGTNGIGVLDAAVDEGCIEGYEMDGDWLRCVTVAVVTRCSDLHEDPDCCETLYWAIYEDFGAVAPHALPGFSAGNVTHDRLMDQVGVGHQELVLSLESWTKCLAWPVLCNPAL